MNYYATITQRYTSGQATTRMLIGTPDDIAANIAEAVAAALYRNAEQVVITPIHPAHVFTVTDETPSAN